MPPVASASAPGSAGSQSQPRAAFGSGMGSGMGGMGGMGGGVNWADRSVNNLHEQKWRLDPATAAGGLLASNGAAGRLAAENAVLREELSGCRRSSCETGAWICNGSRRA